MDWYWLVFTHVSINTLGIVYPVDILCISIGEYVGRWRYLRPVLAFGRTAPSRKNTGHLRDTGSVYYIRGIIT